MNILFISLGCDKNLVDTEVMLGFSPAGAGRGGRLFSVRNASVRGTPSAGI